MSLDKVEHIEKNINFWIFYKEFLKVWSSTIFIRNTEGAF